jgi:hypothetical protein
MEALLVASQARCATVAVWVEATAEIEQRQLHHPFCPRLPDTQLTAPRRT